jgi:hypothetical protein
VGLFDELVCRGAGFVHVVSGPQPAVHVVGAPELVDRVRVRYKRMRVVIAFRVGVDPWRTLSDSGPSFRVVATIDELSRVLVQGYCNTQFGSGPESPFRVAEMSIVHAGSGMISGHISADRLKMKHRGSGQIQLSGDVHDLEISNTGMGVIDCVELVAQRARVSASGLGKSSVMALDQLAVKLTGLGGVSYRGDPVVHRRGDGFGRLEHLP